MNPNLKEAARWSGEFGLWAAVALVCGPGSRAHAEIVETAAVVSTTVQELIDDVPGSVNSDRKQLGVDADQPPLEVSADLLSTDLEGQLVALAQGFSTLKESAANQSNPEELAVEVECYSNAQAVSYSVHGSTVETRSLLFSEIGRDGIAFRRDGTRVIESRVYLNGAIIFWSTRPVQTSTEMQAELSFRIDGPEGDDPLFETALSIQSLDASGAAPSVIGPLQVERVSLADLAEMGADAASLAVLGRVEELGTLLVLVIPPQEHEYSYTVRANEPFPLEAILDARIRNAPDGTGVAAVLGRPFKNLASFIELGLPGVEGQSLERAINLASAKKTLGLVKPNARSSPSEGRVACGALGLETTALLMGVLFFSGRGRRRIRNE